MRDESESMISEGGYLAWHCDAFYVLFAQLSISWGIFPFFSLQKTLKKKPTYAWSYSRNDATQAIYA